MVLAGGGLKVVLLFCDGVTLNVGFGLGLDVVRLTCVGLDVVRLTCGGLDVGLLGGEGLDVPLLGVGGCGTAGIVGNLTNPPAFPFFSSSLSVFTELEVKEFELC